jgi:hypothetical protein
MQWEDRRHLCSKSRLTGSAIGQTRRLALIQQCSTDPLRDSQKNYTIEKIRFLKPDVAVIQVSAQGTGGPNLGTYVMEKQKTVSFTNVARRDSPWKK